MRRLISNKNKGKTPYSAGTEATHPRPIFHDFFFFLGGGGAVAQSEERVIHSEEVPGSTPTITARSLLVGSVSV